MLLFRYNDLKGFRMRITLDEDVAFEIYKSLDCDWDIIEHRMKKEKDKYEKNFEYLCKAIEKELFKPVKTTKRNATKNATRAKIENSKKEIENTVNLMRLQGKKITVNSVANNSIVSYNTVKKYKYLLGDID